MFFNKLLLAIHNSELKNVSEKRFQKNQEPEIESDNQSRRIGNSREAWLTGKQKIFLPQLDSSSFEIWSRKSQPMQGERQNYRRVR